MAKRKRDDLLDIEPPDIATVLPDFRVDRTRPVRPLESDVLSERRAVQEDVVGQQLTVEAEGRAAGADLARASIAALPPRAPATAIAVEIAEMDQIVESARRSPTRANTNFAVKSLIAFPYEELFFEGGEVDRSSRLALNSIASVNKLLSSGKITLDEAIGEIEPFRRQLERTSARRTARDDEVRNGEFLLATEEDARVADEQARVTLTDAVTRQAELEDRIANIETGEDAPDPAIMTTLFRQLADATQEVRTLRTGVTDAGDAFSRARAGRLASLAPQGGARVEFETGEIVTQERVGIEEAAGPDPEERQELARIAAESRAGVGPSEPEKRKIRIDFRARLKAAKTPAEKKELLSEMRAALKGRKTKLVQAREDIAAFDGIDVSGVMRTPELEASDAKFNADLNKRIERIKQAMPGARGTKAKRLQKEFERASKQLVSNLKAQGKVLEKREEANTKRLADALDLARERDANARESKEQTRIDKAAKEFRDAQQAVEDDADKKEATRNIAIEKQAAAAREETAETAVATVKKIRSDAVIRQTVNVTNFDNEIFNDNQAIKTAEADKRKILALPANKELLQSDVRASDEFQSHVKSIKEAKARIVLSRKGKFQLEKRIASVKTNAKVVNGEIAPFPPFPSKPREVITPEAIAAYRLFFGDDDVRKEILDDGWKIAG